MGGYAQHLHGYIFVRFSFDDFTVLYVGDRAWVVRLYGEIIDRTGAQTMLYLTCTTITSIDLAHYRVSRAKDWVSVKCGTISSSRESPNRL